ncbi:Delta(3-5)-Delta(2-4)-dienoyl-CoA isomerase [Penicillium atrosanguineum]|uniref:Delta(3-5)-Delta(2-4)-dienoyl-CoA isomerase n=1 Tax=Penicillium atrosanguineum TaxID=1132637 RepID=UPI002399B5B0|nr:Delta(3-5)-Delta(2-4)-dienoyl-CoA isomerase [Penicillium atrosanguineum]KAJ5297266.1 Delta(3-5)-Delta(2-4)-dienoyl-CoA isomerase [Penicillium atrosanguineum]
MPTPRLEYAFTLHIDLGPAIDYGCAAEGGTMIGICNEGYGRANQETIRAVFEDPNLPQASMANGGSDWYARTIPQFEVANDNKNSSG